MNRELTKTPAPLPPLRLSIENGLPNVALFHVDRWIRLQVLYLPQVFAFAAALGHEIPPDAITRIKNGGIVELAPAEGGSI